MFSIVTGAAGYIGHHLCDRLTSEAEGIYQIDLKYGLDINTCPLPRAENVKHVYHLAAQTDAYSTDAMKDAQTNIMGSLRIFQAYGEKVVFASSAMVNYPVNPYAISKRACEAYARYYGCRMVRLPNVYGKGGHSFMDRCEQQDEITVYGDGEQIREWAHIDHVVNSLMNDFTSLIVVRGQSMSLKEIMGKFPQKKFKYGPAREGDLPKVIQYYSPQDVLGNASTVGLVPATGQEQS